MRAIVKTPAKSRAILSVFAMLLVIGSVIGEIAISEVRIEPAATLQCLDHATQSSMHRPTQRVADRIRSDHAVQTFCPLLCQFKTPFPCCRSLKHSDGEAGSSSSLLKASCLFRI